MNRRDRHARRRTACPDFSADDRRRLARASRDAGQSRRLPAPAVIRDGGRGTEVARVGALSLQPRRDRVLAFNAEGPAGLINGKAPDEPSKLAPLCCPAPPRQR